MKLVPLVLICSIAVCKGYCQHPKSGIYKYVIAFGEWQGKSNGATCTVIIKGDSVLVVNDGSGTISGKKGDVIDAGIIMKHKSGKWIIGHSAADKNASDINGCGDGPRVINFRRKKVWSC